MNGLSKIENPAAGAAFIPPQPAFGGFPYPPAFEINSGESRAISFCLCKKKWQKKKAVAHRDLYAPKRFFSRNTASKSHGRRQPCRGSFLCLAEKPIVLECFAVLNGRFFSAATSALAEILCVFQKRRRKLRGKRFIQNRVNPYAHPPNGGARRNRPSLGRFFFPYSF